MMKLSRTSLYIGTIVGALALGGCSTKIAGGVNDNAKFTCHIQPFEFRSYRCEETRTTGEEITYQFNLNDTRLQSMLQTRDFEANGQPELVEDLVVMIEAPSQWTSRYIFEKTKPRAFRAAQERVLPYAKEIVKAYLVTDQANADRIRGQ